MRVVIVGGGQGGFQVAASLRAEGFSGEVVLIGDEPGVPYQRPPLSKDFLKGKQEARNAELRPGAFYAAKGIELRSGERVEGIDRAGRRVRAASGDVSYDALVLATGTRNRALDVPGAERACYLRTLAEAGALRERMGTAKSVAVIGGGFIGLEVAAAAREMGTAVTVIEGAPRLMARVVAPIISDFFLETHVARGVEVLLGAAVRGIDERGVVLDGRVVEADLVVVGIGVVPNVELARDAGLEVGNGISVDEYLRTGDPHIFAIGDCAEFPSAYTGTRVRLESVQNCVDQAVAVARSIVGRAEVYDAAPWFWTDQFDIRLQMAGLAPTWDQIVLRGTLESRKFSVFYFEEGRLRAVNSVNRPGDHLAARKLIGGRVGITAEQAGDEGFSLK